MRKKISSLLLASLVVLAGCAGTYTDSTGTATDKSATTYKIGVIAPLSGDAAVYGEQMKRIFDFQLAQMAAGGWKQGTFELTYEDGKCDGNPSATALQKLVDVNGINFIIGGACSSESLGIVPLLVEKNAVAVSAVSSNPELEGKSPNFFSFSYSDKLIGEYLADELGKFKKVALISEQNDYNQGIKKVVEATLAAKYPDTVVVANEEFPKGATDMRNVLDKVKNAAPDAVLFNPNVGVTTETMVRQLAEIKDWKPQFIGIQGFLSDETIALAPETLEGMIIVDAPKVDAAAFTALYDQITAEYGTLGDLGTFYAAATLDSFNVLTAAISENNGDVAKVLQALSTESFNANVGKVKFGGKTFAQGITAAKFLVQSGKAEQVK